MDLFEYMRSTNMEKESPLAARMRPRTLEEVVGQEHIIGKDKLRQRTTVIKGALTNASYTIGKCNTC